MIAIIVVWPGSSKTLQKMTAIQHSHIIYFRAAPNDYFVFVLLN